MPLSTLFQTISKFALLSTLSATAIFSQGICSNQIKNDAVNACTSSCGDIGECIFGCEIGGINDVDVCQSSCTGLGSVCLNACLSVTQQITRACTQTSDVTSSLTFKLGTVVYNRATGMWQQTVVITNTTENTVNAPGYILDALNSGWTLFNRDGTTSQLLPTGSPFKNLGPVPPNSAVSVTLQFTRTGATALTYSPRVLSGTAR